MVIFDRIVAAEFEMSAALRALSSTFESMQDYKEALADTPIEPESIDPMELAEREYKIGTIIAYPPLPKMGALPQSETDPLQAGTEREVLMKDLIDPETAILRHPMTKYGGGRRAIPPRLKEPPFVLLKPDKVLPAYPAVTTLLGCVVQNINEPLATYQPENVSSILSALQNCVSEEYEFVSLAKDESDRTLYDSDTEFEAKESAITVQSSLRNLLEHRPPPTVKSPRSCRVVTYRLNKHEEVLHAINKSHEAALFGMIARAEARNREAIFMVVGLKIASFEGKSQTIDVKSEPVGKPGRAGLDSALNKEDLESLETKTAAQDATVFAIQYRLVRRGWLRSVGTVIERVRFTDNLESRGVVPSELVLDDYDDTEQEPSIFYHAPELEGQATIVAP